MNLPSITEHEKAAFVLGMYHAFRAGNFPKNFNRDDKAGWLLRAKDARRILNNSAVNPLYKFRLRQLADEEIAALKLPR